MRFKIIVTSFLVLCSSICYAQFRSSEDVYCYRYEKTIEDGISSKSGEVKQIFIFVNFQNDMMGYAVESDIKRLRLNLSNNSDYYNDRARKNIAERNREWRGQPKVMGLGTTIINYCSEYSTSSKYTYRYQSKTAIGQLGVSMYWSEPKWQEICFSFSKDRQELIKWDINDTEKRDYYKLFDAESTQPNLDFLNE